MEFSTNEKSYLAKSLVVLAVVVTVYFGAKTVSEIKGYRFIGGGSTASNTISFDGKGEVFAAPDMATVSFTIRETSKDVKDAQTKATAKETAVLAFLDKSGVAKKDIKTESYNSYPKYDYGTPCYGYMMPCRQEPKVTGYEVSEYVSVKIRDLAKAGEIVKGIGEAGISEISGPDFSIEKEDQLKEQSRKMAIEEAKKKAEALAKDLGVNLVRIVNFSENGNYPYYAAGLMKADARAESVSAPAPALPTGENKITSNVTITYEIR
jgi:uncharacterized protein YggE